jgi:hypothetical protein
VGAQVVVAGVVTLKKTETQQISQIILDKIINII